MKAREEGRMKNVTSVAQVDETGNRMYNSRKPEVTLNVSSTREKLNISRNFEKASCYNLTSEEGGCYDHLPPLMAHVWLDHLPPLMHGARYK